MHSPDSSDSCTSQWYKVGLSRPTFCSNLSSRQLRKAPETDHLACRLATLNIPILDLKPAQIAIGLLEVEHKVKDYAHLSREDFQNYSGEHPVPVVQSSHGYYIIDHHHLCRAFHELGHHHVHIFIKDNLSGVDLPKFWEMMEAMAYVLPQDQFGVIHPYQHLPIDVRGMADDPYRSLVWRLKERACWRKVNVPFAEFKVANFFRDKVEIWNTKESFDLAVEAAIHLLEVMPKDKFDEVPGLSRPGEGPDIF